MWNKPSDSERIDAVTTWLDATNIAYDLYFHPASPTIELAKRHWRDDGSKHCKNLFFRNHKGNRHYLVCFDCDRTLSIHDLEARLHQGKLSFASPERMMRYLGLEPGSVSPFGLINDAEHHVPLSRPQPAVLPVAEFPPQRLPRHGSHRPHGVRTVSRAGGQQLRVSRSLRISHYPRLRFLINKSKIYCVGCRATTACFKHKRFLSSANINLNICICINANARMKSF